MFYPLQTWQTPAGVASLDMTQGQKVKVTRWHNVFNSSYQLHTWG